MAASDRIEYNDLVAEGAFEKIIEKAEQLVEIFGKAEVAIKGAMIPLKSGLKVSPTTVGEVEQIQTLTKKVNDLEGALTKTKAAKEKLTLETAKARIEQENYNKSVKELAKESLGLVSEYKMQSKLLEDMRNRYKDLAVVQQQSTAEGKLLLKNITTLDQKLKSVDATVGQHERHVGNYRGAIKELGKGLHGLTGVVTSIGSAFGLNTEHLEHAAHLTKELVKVSKELTHASKIASSAKEIETLATEANTVAAETNVVAKEAEVVAVEASNAAWLATPLGIFAAVALGIAAVTLAVMEFTQEEEDSAEAIHIFNEAINEQDKNITKLKLSILETTIANKVLTGQMTQDTSDRLHITFDMIKAESDAVHRHKSAMLELNKEYAAKEKEATKHQVMGLFQNAEQVQFLERERKKKLLIMENKFQTEMSLIKADQALKNAEIANKRTGELTEKDHKEKIEKEIDFSRILRDLETENIRLSYERRKKEIHNNYDDEAEKYAGQTEILKQLGIKRGRLLEDLYREQEKEYDRIRNGAIKQDGLKKMDVADDPKFSPKVSANQDAIKKKKEDDDKADKEAQQDAIKQAETLLNIWKEAEAKKAAARMEANQHELDQNKTNLEIQATLAAAGLDNTLAFEMEKQQRLEKERVEELERQKKVAQRQEAVELGLAFLKAYQAELSSGKKPAQALSLAATETIAAKLLGKAIAGNFATGVENFQGAGTGTSDSNIIGFSHGESVLTAKGTSETEGLATAVNKKGFDGVVDWAMENIYKPQFNSGTVLSDVSKSDQVDSSLSKKLIEKVENLTKVIQDKPETKVSLTGIGDVITEVYKRGQRSVTIKKRSLN